MLSDYLGEERGERELLTDSSRDMLIALSRFNTALLGADSCHHELVLVRAVGHHTVSDTFQPSAGKCKNGTGTDVLTLINSLPSSEVCLDCGMELEAARQPLICS